MTKLTQQRLLLIIFERCNIMQKNCYGPFISKADLKQTIIVAALVIAVSFFYFDLKQYVSSFLKIYLQHYVSKQISDLGFLTP